STSMSHRRTRTPAGISPPRGSVSSRRHSPTCVRCASTPGGSPSNFEASGDGMKDALAEKLLAHVMQWGPQQVAHERPYLQAIAAYKYDEYQQFSPGMRFVESLARWLSQFKTPAERQTAFEFVKSRLLFVSVAEMNHLAESAYPDHIRPSLLRRAAAAMGANR